MIQSHDESKPVAPAPLTAEQLDRFRELLVEERRKTQDSLLKLHREAIQNNPDNLGDSMVRTHLSDLASETYEQEEDLSLVEQLGKLLTDVERALDRLQEDAYGTCEDCGTPIPLERLEAIPSAARCAQCQSRREKEQESN